MFLIIVSYYFLFIEKNIYKKVFYKLQKITLKYELCKLYESCKLYQLCKLYELYKLYVLRELYELCN